jgi:hypothetical protein
MPDLSFQVDGAEVVPFAVAPLLAFRLDVTNATESEVIHTVVLRCQLQIDVTRRRYTPEEEGRLRDLFGEPARWSQTLRTMLWTHASAVVQSFTGKTRVNLSVPCTFDFNVAATKYFYGLTQGEVPLTLLFSGSVFYEDATGALQVAPISWEKEATFRLPVRIWHELMNAYYPNEAWLHIRRDAFDRLYRYKVSRGIPTWEQALDALLPATEEAPV